MAYQVSDSAGQTATANLSVTVTGQPPVPADVTGSALTTTAVNTAAATAVGSLRATDDGTVTSYTVVTLPAVGSGVLYLADGATPVTAGMVLTPAQAAGLTFAPASGFVGTASFDYTATDNQGLPSTANKNLDGTVTAGPATFTIPVQASPGADLRISKTINGTTATQISRAPGSTVFYYVRVTNNGPSAVANPVVQDTLPTGMTFGSTACTGMAGNLCSSTVSAPTAAQLQTGYSIPTTLASGAFFEFYVTASIGSPNVAGTRYADNTARVTAPAGITDSFVDNNTATARVLVDAPPVSNDLTNTLMLSGAPATALSLPLSATDPDGTVASYTVSQLPPAASGVLYLADGTTPVTTAMILTPAQSASLTFDPAPNFAGTTTFQYTATDNDGLRSVYAQPSSGAPIYRAAYYSIPVSSTNTPLPCASLVYGIFGTASNSITTVNALDSSGNKGAPVAVLPFTDTAAMAISSDGTRVFIAGSDYVLRMYTVTTGSWTTLGNLSKVPGITTRPLRMTIDRNGTGYMSVANYLWTFNGNATSSADANLSAPKSLSFNDTSGLAPAPLLGDISNQSVSGDLIVDNDGNLYLLANPNSTNYMDIFRIQGAAGSTPMVTYAGRLRDPDIGSANIGGFAALESGIYTSTDGGRLLNTDLGALSVSLVNSNIGVSTDLGSCYFPTLRPILVNNKTVSNVTSSTTSVKPGDTLEYTITIHNSGNISADGVSFQDAIPAGATYVASSTTLNGAALADAGGTMPFVTAQSVRSPATSTVVASDIMNGQVIAGSDVTIRFRVTVDAGVTSVSNQGTVTYRDNSTGTTVSTPTLTDDPATPAPRDPTVISAAAPVLSIDKQVDARFVRVTPDSETDTSLMVVPQQLTYTLGVKNSGNVAATAVVVTDTLPGGLSLVSARDSSGASLTNTSVSGNPQDVSFTLPDVAAGTTQTLTLLTKVNTQVNANQSAYLNRASVSASGLSAVTSVQVRTDVIYPRLRKTVQNITRGTQPGTTSEGLPGEVLEYCLAYDNFSSAVLPAYTITDQVPRDNNALVDAYGPGLGISLSRPGGSSTLTAAADGDAGRLTTAGGQYGQGSLTLSLGDLPAGESGQTCFRTTIR